MDELMNAIFELVSNTPPPRIDQLAELLRELDGPISARRIESWALTPGAEARLSKLIQCWKDSQISPCELSGMLVAASHAYHYAKAESKTELVWTGPSSELMATRKTEQALLEVINAARDKFFLTSFVAYDVAPIMTALANASERAVDISMLLESSDRHGGGVSIDAIGQMKTALPTANIYFWGEKGDSFAGGKVHAKVAVSDEEFCFISSANLTGHAMEKNMELGVLIRGGAVPRNLHRHLEALITTKILQRA